MNVTKPVAMCGALFLTAFGVTSFTTAAEAKRPVVVRAQPADSVTRRVTYHDLNLASLAGEKQLNKRVNQAVRGVCFEANGSTSDINILQSCRIQAWRGARPQVADAVLRAQQIAATGQSLIAFSAITLRIGE